MVGRNGTNAGPKDAAGAQNPPGALFPVLKMLNEAGVELMKVTV
jgi:hypothetical protein